MTTVYAKLTASQVDRVRNAVLPAPKELIVTMLARLAMHKRMDADENKQEIMFRDCADLLFGVPEYALVRAVVDFIELDTSPWFPTLAAIRQSFQDYIVTGVAFEPATDNAGQVGA